MHCAWDAPRRGDTLSREGVRLRAPAALSVVVERGLCGRGEAGRLRGDVTSPFSVPLTSSIVLNRRGGERVDPDRGEPDGRRGPAQDIYFITARSLRWYDLWRGQHPPDVVFDFVGGGEALRSGGALLKPGGKFITAVVRKMQSQTNFVTRSQPTFPTPTNDMNSPASTSSIPGTDPGPR